jgi:hypothetical protein
MLKLLAAATLAASLTAWAQSDMRPSQSTDKEKIADALRAGPEFITKDAVIADWPANPKDPNPQYRVLRAGKSDWTCLPGIPGYPHDEPMCLDNTSMQWIKDSLADRPVRMRSRRRVRCRSFGVCWRATSAAWRLREVTANLPDRSQPARWKLSGSGERCGEQRN